MKKEQVAICYPVRQTNVDATSVLNVSLTAQMNRKGAFRMRSPNCEHSLEIIQRMPVP